MNEDIFIHKILPYIFTANCIYVWVVIILGTIQLFGSGLLATIIGLPVVCLNVYVHINAYLYVEQEYQKYIKKKKS